MTYGITPVFYKNYQALMAKNPDGSRRYKYIINTGSSRSSKTWSLIELMHRICENNESFRVTAWRDTKVDARATIWKDFQKVLTISKRMIYANRNKTESYYAYPEQNTTFEIHGADDEEKVHGLTQNVSWLNEPYKISKDTFDQIDMRSDVMFIDWNPKKSHWIDNLSKQKNAIVIHSTFLDNEFCPEEQRKKILSYEPNPYNISQQTANLYKWQVYGLGLKGEVEGRIYHWSEISILEYDNINKEVYYGCDWGLVDPFAIVECKYHDGNLYVHEKNYQSENDIRSKLTQTEMHQINASQDEGLVTWLFTKLGIPKTKYIFADNNRPTKIQAARRSGWEYCGAVGGKSKLLDRIGILQSLNIYYTSTSKNIEYEQENYSYRKDKFGVQQEEPIDQDNHCFEGNTLITTINGQVPIKNIKVGDLVLTTKGYKKVLKKFNNGIKKVNVYSMLFPTFSLSLTCTDTHNVKTLNKWKPIKDLNKYSMDVLTIYMPMKNILVKAQKDYIGLFGNITMVKYLRDMIYTIKMKINLIMKLIISRLLNQKIMVYCMGNYDLLKIQNGLKVFKKKDANLQKSGINLKKVGSGILSTQKKTDLENLNTQIKNAINVKKHTAQITAYKNSVQINVLQNTEEALELTTKKESVLYVNQSLSPINIQNQKLVAVHVQESYNTEVYDLMIEDQHEYFANGVLVHNCIDAIAYCVQKLFDLGIIKSV